MLAQFQAHKCLINVTVVVIIQRLINKGYMGEENCKVMVMTSWDAVNNIESKDLVNILLKFIIPSVDRQNVKCVEVPERI